MSDKKIDQKSITLVLTHRCNLRCTYCYEKNKDGMTMPLDLAIRIVEHELTLDDGIDSVEFDLFGGEPLLELDTIKGLIEHVKQREYPKDYIFFITTNGVALDAERKAWLAENTDYLQMGLSLDGTKEMHDKNRSNSFDAIDLDFFHNTYPAQSVKMTISAETLPQLAEGVLFCQEKGFHVACNLAYGIDWSAPENVRILEEQLMLLIRYYAEHPDVTPCAMLDINRLKSLSYSVGEYKRYCGAGYAMKAYDYDGQVYPCQHFLPIAIGKERALESLKINFPEYVTDSSAYSERCQKCVIRNVCPTCYGENFSSTGDIHKRDETLCTLFKIQFKALAYFVSELFRRGHLGKYSPAERAALLKSAIMIDKELD